MTPVDMLQMSQRERGIFGDCLRACVASLLDLPAESVPHFLQAAFKDRRMDEVLIYIADFLKPLGLGYLAINMPTRGLVHAWPWYDCYHIMTGPTERGTHHAVVGYDGEMVHDPHPSRAGLLSCDGLVFLVSLCGGAP